MMANNNGPPNMGNIMSGRIMQNQQAMLPNGPRMVRTPNMIPRFQGGMVTQNPGGHPLRPGTMQVRMAGPGQVINSGLPPGSVAMVSHSGQFVSTTVPINTSAPMQMAPPNGIRQMPPAQGMQSVVTGAPVNLPPQYPTNQRQHTFGCPEQHLPTNPGHGTWLWA